MKNKTNKKIWGKIISKSIKARNFTSNARDRFANFFELPEEIRKDTTKTTIISNDSVLIEGYNKIADYFDNYVTIKGKGLDIIIDGKNLDIREVTDEELVVIGQIYSVNYKKNGVE